MSYREKVVEHSIPRLYGTDDPQFIRTMGTLLGTDILDGNQVDVLLNGGETFHAMLQSIRRAEKTITFETFIYWSGSIGSEFSNALAERAHTGVKVHVLLDWIGSYKMDASQLVLMEQAGVEVRKYHKPHWYHSRNGRTGRLSKKSGSMQYRFSARSCDPRNVRLAIFGSVTATPGDLFVGRDAITNIVTPCFRYIWLLR